MGQSQFAGSWRLVAFESQRGETVTRPFGDNPDGLIMWDGGGNFSAQIMRGDLQPVVRPGEDLAVASDADVRRLYAGLVAYWGTYEVDEANSTLIHHVIASWNPAMVGVDQLRRFEFEGNRVTLRPPDRVDGGEAVTSRLTWERVY